MRLFLSANRYKLRTSYTESAPIERRRSIKFYDFSAAHSGHFCYFYVQKYSNFEQKLSKNDHCVPNLCLMAFYSRVVFCRRGYGR